MRKFSLPLAAFLILGFLAPALAQAAEGVLIVENYNTLPAYDIELHWGEGGHDAWMPLSPYIERSPYHIENSVVVRDPGPGPRQTFVIPNVRTDTTVPTHYIEFKVPQNEYPGATRSRRMSLSFLPPPRSAGRATLVTILHGVEEWYGTWSQVEYVPYTIPIVGFIFPRPAITGFSPRFVATGTVVTVSGNNFVPWAGAPIEVRVGTRLIPALIETTNQRLSFRIPRGVAGGQISITTAGGTATTSRPLMPLMTHY